MPLEQRKIERENAVKALAVSPGTIRRWATLKVSDKDEIPVKAALYFSEKLGMDVKEFCTPLKNTNS